MGPERVLLTGATGFVGRHLARALVDRGAEVVALVRPGSSRSVPAGVTAVAVPRSAADLEEAVRAARADACVHLATHYVAQHRPDEVEALLQANVIFGARLAEALAAVGGVPLVDVGTVWQHVDNAPYRPANLYAASKQALADLLVAYSLRSGLPVVRVTLTDTYGPDDDRPRLVPLLVEAASSGAPVYLASGTQLVDLVHIDDVVAAFAAVLDRLAEEPAWPEGDGSSRVGVSSGAPITIRQLVAAVERVSGHRLAVEWGARPDRDVEMREPWDPGPPPAGWQPHVDLVEGLADLVARNPDRAGR